MLWSLPDLNSYLYSRLTTWLTFGWPAAGQP